MKSLKSARIAFKSAILTCTCIVLYFLSTGPTVLWLSTTESDTVKNCLYAYLTPLIAIDRRFNHYSQLKQAREEALRYVTPEENVSFYFDDPEPSFSHEVILGYMKAWGEDACLQYKYLCRT